METGGGFATTEMVVASRRALTPTNKWEKARDLLRDREGDIAKGVPISPKIGRLRFDDAAKDLLTD